MTQSDDMAVLIWEIRGRLGLTQEKFAAKLGVTLPTINRWENGRSRPSPLASEKIKELLQEMGMGGDDSMARLFDRATKPSPEQGTKTDEHSLKFKRRARRDAEERVL